MIHSIRSIYSVEGKLIKSNSYKSNLILTFQIVLISNILKLRVHIYLEKYLYSTVIYKLFVKKTKNILKGYLYIISCNSLISCLNYFYSRKIIKELNKKVK